MNTLNLILIFSTLFCLLSFSEQSNSQEMSQSHSMPDPVFFEFLPQDTLVHGVPLKKDTQVFFWDEQKLHVKNGVLSKDHQINGMLLKKGTAIELFRDGKLSSGYLAKSSVIGGVEAAKDSKISFRESGKLFSYFPTKPYVSKGMTFKDLTELVFFDNGGVASGYLTKNAFINGLEFKGGTQISFYYTGNVVKGIIARKVVYSGFELQSDSSLTLWDNGKIQYLSIPDDQTIRTVKFPKNSTIFFNEAGEFLSVTNSKNYSLFGIELKGGTEYIPVADLANSNFTVTTKLYKSGKPQSGQLAKNQTIHGIEFKKDSSIELYENGRVEMGFVSKDSTIDGKLIKAGARIQLEESGKLRN